MYVAMNHIPVAADQEEAFEARFAARARLVDQMPGFHSFELLRPIPRAAHGPGGNASALALTGNRPDEYLVLTRWDERAGFEAWATGDARRQGHRATAGAGEGPRLTTGPSWLTTHETFETAYAPGWTAIAASAAAPVAMMNVIEVAGGYEALFEEVFRTREHGVEQQPGFLTLEVLAPADGLWRGGAQGGMGERPDVGRATDATDAEGGRAAGTYVVFSRWASTEAHDAWTHSEAFRRAHGRRRLPEGAVVRSAVRAARILLPAYGQHVPTEESEAVAAAIVAS